MGKQRVYTLKEFSGHSGGNINCLRIGKKSGRVLVTGGDDKKVSMWALGKGSAVMSLSGHNASVECVCFDMNEEVVVAGSCSGSLKLWDLDQQKVVRSLNGHRAACRAVDFHPFGEFFASGSQDPNLKIWDIRRKGCIQTYRGHSDGISTLRFSPDGRWVVSGGQDGIVRLWDLTAGKPIREFTTHSAPITDVQFHPNEFLLATSSLDRTIKFWDLETFEEVTTAIGTSNPISSILFTPDPSISPDSDNPQGETGCLLAASLDGLKSWGWEPVRNYDTVPVQWNKIADMNITADQLICCGLEGSTVTVWGATIGRIRPFSKEAEAAFDPKFRDLKSNLDLNRDYVGEMKALEDSFKAMAPKPRTTKAPEKKQPKQAPRKVHTPTEPPSQPILKEKVLHQIEPEIHQDPASYQELTSRLLASHDSLCSILKQRRSNLDVICAIWARGDLKEALEAMGSLNDPAVVADVLGQLFPEQSTGTGCIFTLDMCVATLPLLLDLLSAKQSEMVMITLRASINLAKSFGGVIRDTLAAEAGGIFNQAPVDINRDERAEKCRYCLRGFLSIKEKLEAPFPPSTSSQIRNTANQLVELIQTFS